MKLRAVLGSIVLATWLGGCSAVPPEPAVDASETAEFEAIAAPILERARSAGAASGQIAVLEEAVALGSLEFDAYETSVEAFYECLDDAGIRYERHGIDRSRGFPFILYFFEASDSTGPIAADCHARNLLYVEELYQLQPSSVDVVERRFSEAVPQLIACLNREGYPVDDGATEDEVKVALSEMLSDSSRMEADPQFVPNICLDEAGIDAY